MKMKAERFDKLCLISFQIKTDPQSLTGKQNSIGRTQKLSYLSITYYTSGDVIILVMCWINNNPLTLLVLLIEILDNWEYFSYNHKSYIFNVVFISLSQVEWPALLQNCFLLDISPMENLH